MPSSNGLSSLNPDLAKSLDEGGDTARARGFLTNTFCARGFARRRDDYGRRCIARVFARFSAAFLRRKRKFSQVSRRRRSSARREITTYVGDIRKRRRRMRAFSSSLSLSLPPPPGAKSRSENSYEERTLENSAQSCARPSEKESLTIRRDSAQTGPTCARSRM